MSQAPTDENLQKARERVMQLAREVEGLSREPIPPNEFFPGFLTRVVSAVGAQAGAVWLLHEQSVALAAEVRLAEVGLNEPGVRQLNDAILGQVLSTGEACTITHDDGSDLQLPTDHMQVLCALHKVKQCVGVVQLFQRSDAPEEARAGYLQFLEQMSGYASRYIEGKGRKNQEEEDAPTSFWHDLEPFTLRLQQTLNSEEVAEIAASDGRLLLEVDRLSIVTKKGAKVAVKAVSGQTSVNPRANLIRAMSELGQQVIAMGEPLMYTGKIDDLAPQIEKPLADFVQESTSRMVYIVPFFENLRVVKPDKEVETGRKLNTRREAIGCIVVEQVAESEPGPALVQRTELLSDHIGAAMDNARTQERIFGIGVWRRIGRTIEWFHGRRLAIAGAIAAAIILAAGLLTLVNAEYKVEAEGKVMPVQKVGIFAPEDAQIRDLYVEGNNNVKEGDLLLTLFSEQINSELVAAEGELNNANGKYQRLAEEIDLARNKRGEDGYTESQRLEAELEETKIQIEQLIKKVKIRKDRMAELKVEAPLTGLVPELNLRQKLDKRKVQKGQKLFEVMAIDGEWHLEVKLPDKRMGHFLNAVEEAKNNRGPDDGLLDAEYTLTSSPDLHYPCQVTGYETRTVVDGENGTVVRLFVKPIGEIPPDDRRIGAEVRVKINCGQKSLGYKMFGDIVEAWHKYTWF